jgi:FAD/FMN-containing dehydrogenase
MVIAHDVTIRTLSDYAVRSLEQRLRGTVVRPSDGDYDQARRVWNPAIDRYPALVVRPRCAADVYHAVDFARAHNVTLAVRSGGHSLDGHGTVDGGLVIDLSTMKRLVIDPVRRMAWAEPGLTWGEYLDCTDRYRLATPSGDARSVGLGGLTLGGGIGWLVRKHGLTIDNLLAVDVVTADGRRVQASEYEHPDLYWALRGGGGNFGVATGFRFRLQPVSPILGGAIVYPATAEVLREYVDAAAAAPDELSTITFVMQAPPAPFIPADAHGKPVVFITACYAGDLTAGQRAIAPLRALAGTRPIADTTAPMPYAGMFDLLAGAEQGKPHAVRAGYLSDVSDDLIESILVYCNQVTSPFSFAEIRVLGGAMARVPAEATAFAHRDKSFFLAIASVWEDGLEQRPERHVAWTEAFWRAVALRTDGAYVNFLQLQNEGEERIRAAYPPATYARLAAIKRRYDPDNLFRINANVRPA